MLINLSLGFISFVTSTMLFLLILIISFFSLYKHHKGKLFLILISSILVWSYTLTLSQIGESIAFEIIFIAEVLRYFSWFYILLQVSGYYIQNPYKITNLHQIPPPLLIIVVLVTALISVLYNHEIAQLFEITNPVTLHTIWMIIFSVIGLLLVENLIRSTSSEHADSIKFLAISAGTIFSYDIFVFSNALLINQIDYEYWSMRGIINILIIPTLIIAAVRNPSLAPRLHISRQFVFHSATLIGTGFYLILMSIAGYLIKQNSGHWGWLLQISFLFFSFALLVSLFFSSYVKISLKRFLGRNFRNKYDYRREWYRFSNTLLIQNPKDSIYKRAVIAVAQIIDCQGGSVWIDNNNSYQCYSGWKVNVDNFLPISVESEFIQYIHSKKTLFTLDEYQAENKSIRKVNYFNKDNNSWLILPLWNEDKLFGFIHLLEPRTPTNLDIEDFDLLETITHHVSLSLSLNESITALQQADRFKQINHMTTFLVHDLKTLLSQLSLLVENGIIHKNNPEFIDDMLNTLDHVTQKMQRLILQLKEPSKQPTRSFCNISNILEAIVHKHKLCSVRITLIKTLSIDTLVHGSEQALESSINHLIQNAMDSIHESGEIIITIFSASKNRVSITIRDNGTGMSKDFIDNHLFTPFDSTKGVSGMGIGVYQSREYFRSLNGDISVISALGTGSTFTITLPEIAAKND